MANGYVPHFMFPGVPLSHPQTPHTPPSAAERDPGHPSANHFEPLNYAYLPPGHHHHSSPHALPAPNAGGQSYSSLLNDHAHLSSPPQHPSPYHFPPSIPSSSPNIIPRFWLFLFANPIHILTSIYNALHHIYTSLQNNKLFSTLLTTLSSNPTTLISLLTIHSSWSLLIGLLVVIAFGAASWFLAPKGENLTVWRSTLILSAASCYLMWAIVFLAQWHPLIEPKMTKLRPGYLGGS